MWLNPRVIGMQPSLLRCGAARAYGLVRPGPLSGAARRQLLPDVGLGRTVVGPHDLHAHVVRAGVEVGLDPRRDVGRAAPGHDGVDQAIAAGRCQVLVGVAEGAEVVGVVGQGQVAGAELAGQRPSRGRVGLQDDGLLRGQERPGAELGAGDGRVLGRHEVGVGAGRPRPRQLEHPWSQGGEDAHVGRLARGVELVEVAAHLGQRRDVLLADQPLVAHAQPEEEPVAAGGAQRRRLGRDLAGVVAPDVEDAGGHDEVGRGVQRGAAAVEHVAARSSGDPEGAVAGRLDGRRRRTDRTRVPAPQTAPDADSTQLDHAVTLRRCHGAGLGRGRPGVRPTSSTGPGRRLAT